ncbi:hypothetical protein QBC98_007676 [Kitasatospora acidiphila]
MPVRLRIHSSVVSNWATSAALSISVLGRQVPRPASTETGRSRRSPDDEVDVGSRAPRRQADRQGLGAVDDDRFQQFRLSGQLDVDPAVEQLGENKPEFGLG